MHNQHTHKHYAYTHMHVRTCKADALIYIMHVFIYMYAGISLIHSCIIYVCTPSAVHAQFEAMYLYTYTYIYVCITNCIKLFNLMNAKSVCGGAMEFLQIWTS